MHQRPPVDPYNNDDLLLAADRVQNPAPTTRPDMEEETGPEAGAHYHGHADGVTAASTTVDLLDDVFGGGDDDAGGDGETQTTHESHDDHPSDMNRLQQDHSTAGYRDGLTAGKNASLQAGFDEGYALGAALGGAAGALLGLLEGLAAAGDADADSAGDTGDMGDTAAALLMRARAELALPSIFSTAYFAPDGTWAYEVAGDNDHDHDHDHGKDADGPTVFDVARAHPLVHAWRSVVDAQLARRSVHWGRAAGGDDEAAATALAAALGLAAETGAGDTVEAVEAVKAVDAAASMAAGRGRAAPAGTSALDW